MINHLVAMELEVNHKQFRKKSINYLFVVSMYYTHEIWAISTFIQLKWSVISITLWSKPVENQKRDSLRIHCILLQSDCHLHPLLTVRVTTDCALHTGSQCECVFTSLPKDYNKCFWEEFALMIFKIYVWEA